MSRLKPEGPPPPEPPPYDLKRIRQLRQRLREVMIDFAHAQLTLVNQVTLTRRIWAVLGRSVKERAVRETLRPLGDRVLDDDLIEDLAWRLAGNLPTLRQDMPARPWAGQSRPEWAPMKVIAVVPVVDGRGRASVQLAAKVLAGSPCPLVVRAVWTRNTALSISRIVGFQPPKPGRSPDRCYVAPEQFGGLTFYGLFEPTRGGDEPPRPRFTKVRCKPSLRERNADLLKARAVKPCDFGRTNACHVCPIGLDRCPLAVHTRTFVAAPCVSCGRPDAPHDPGIPGPCVDCVRRSPPQVRRG